MKFAPLSLAVLYAGLGSVEALQLTKRDNPAVLGMPIERRAMTEATRTRRLTRRANTVNVVLNAIESTAYYAKVSIGSPGQSVTLDVDTGSSDTWVLAPNATACENNGCSANGVFNSNKSSTFKIVNDQFQVQYGDGSVATGSYVTDTLSISGATLKDFEFGLATDFQTQVGDSATLSGLIGIGYPGLEGIPNSYANMPVALAKAGIINTPAYSLWLDDLAANKGQLLFGGVNKAKYEGELATLPLLTREGYDQPFEFFVELTDLSINNGSTTSISQSAQSVLLDSGSQYMTLRSSQVEKIVNHFNGFFDEQSGAIVLPCSLQSSKATLDFAFGAQTIHVPITELLVGNDVDPKTGKPLADQNGNALCLLGISPAESGDPLILGDTFLRSAYVVYDLGNFEVSIANTKFNSTTDDIVEITGSNNGPDTVPGATTLGTAAATTLGASETGRGILGQPTQTENVGGIPIVTGKVRTNAGSAQVPSNGIFGLVAAIFGALALL